jgi:hypothetical protein
VGIQPVQQGTVLTAGSSPAVFTLPGPSSPGTLLEVSLVDSSPADTFTFPAGWAQGPNLAGTGQSQIWFYPNNPGGISSISVTYCGGGSIRGQASEWSGVTLTNPLDTSGSNSASAPPLVVTSAAHVAGAGELAITCFHQKLASSLTQTTTPGTGWTSLGNNDSRSTSNHFSSDYLIGPAAGAAASETETVLNTAEFEAVIAVFTAAAAPPLGYGSINPGLTWRRQFWPGLRYQYEFGQRGPLGFTAAPSDSVGAASDSVVGGVGHPRAVADGVGPAAESVVRAYQGGRAPADSVGAATDSPATQGGYARAPAETVGPASESAQRAYAGGRAPAELVGPASEVAARAFIGARTTSDAVGPAADSSPTATHDHQRSPSETVGPAAETVVRAFAGARRPSDAVGPASDVVVGVKISSQATPGEVWVLVDGVVQINGSDYDHEFIDGVYGDVGGSGRKWVDGRGQ